MAGCWRDRRRLPSKRRNSATTRALALLENIGALLYLQEDKDFGRISWLINRIPQRRLRAW
jgi:hypothetical protein